MKIGWKREGEYFDSILAVLKDISNKLEPQVYTMRIGILGLRLLETEFWYILSQGLVEESYIKSYIEQLGLVEFVYDKFLDSDLITYKGLPVRSAIIRFDGPETIEYIPYLITTYY